MNTTNFLLMLLGSCLVLCFVLMLMNNTDRNTEGFDPVIDAIQTQLQNESPEQLKSTVQALQQRLIDYGYAPDLKTYVKKTDLGPNDGKCLMSNAEDRDKYVSKSDIPPAGPRIDLSQYVKKSSIPPEKVCPPTPEIDYSAYVKKSTLPPNEKCPPCIAPKVKVSAGLCRECPPAPSCPAPERCPVVSCPLPAPCPAQKDCPAPAPCPTVPKCVKCDEIRYIKVPAIITKTVTVDKNGNIISQKIDSGNTNPTAYPSTTLATTTTQINTTTTSPQTTSPQTTSPQTTSPQTTSNDTTFLNNIFGSSSNQIPSTTFPVMSSIPNTTLAQTIDNTYGTHNAFCPSAELNSEFKSYGIYGP